MVSPRSSVLGFTFRSMDHSELIFLYGTEYRHKFTIIFFVYGYPIVSASSVEKAVLSPLNCFCTFVENQLLIHVWVHFWTPCSVPLSICLR